MTNLRVCPENPEPTGTTSSTYICLWHVHYFDPSIRQGVSDDHLGAFTVFSP